MIFSNIEHNIIKLERILDESQLSSEGILHHSQQHDFQQLAGTHVILHAAGEAGSSSSRMASEQGILYFTSPRSSGRTVESKSIKCHLTNHIFEK